MTLLLVVLMLVVYLPALRAGFIWDDQAMTDNPVLESATGLRTIWMTPALHKNERHYWPLTYTSFWLERRVWGLHPFGYHLDNVLLHVADTLLLWWLLRRLRAPGSWLGAALFGLHPIHVESVAWVIERKDVLMGFFYVLALHAWLRFVDKRDGWALILTLPLTAAAMLSKSMAVSLPVTMAMLAWWRVGRVRWLDALALVLPAGLTAALTWLDYHIYLGDAADWPLNLTLWDRFVLAGRSLWYYFRFFCWPVGLAPLYPRPAVNASFPLQWSWLGLAFLTLLAFWLFRRRLGRGPLTVAVIYAATLAPVLGIIEFRFMIYSYTADRFMYLASAALAGGVGALAARLTGARRGLAVVAALILLTPLMVLTWRQAALYNDTLSLLQRNVERYPRVWAAHCLLGVELTRAGRAEEGVVELRKALALQPDSPEVPYQLGRALADAGQENEAIDVLREFLNRQPNHGQAHDTLAVLYARQGLKDAALAHYRLAVTLAPNEADAHGHLGTLLADLGQWDKGLAELNKALALKPNDPEALNNRGTIRLERGDLEAAAADFTRALTLRPDYVSALGNLGSARLRQGRVGEAIEQFNRALKLKADNAGLHFNLGAALERRGDRRAAAEQYAEALRLDPQLRVARARLEALRAGSGWR